MKKQLIFDVTAIKDRMKSLDCYTWRFQLSCGLKNFPAGSLLIVFIKLDDSNEDKMADFVSAFDFCEVR